MQVLRLRRKTTSRIELVNLVITTYCLFSGTKVNKTDVDVLSYLAVYGFKKSTKDTIIKSRILNSANSLENTICKLRKMGLIERNRDGENVIKKELQFTVENDMGIIIKLENL